MKKLLFSLLMFVAMAAMAQTEIPNTPNALLQDGMVYSVSNNTTITATEAGQSGLQVAQGAKVVINIKAGVTLSVTGADADASKGFPGMPGILVPETSTLVLIGEGELVAKGGNGSYGLSGQKGGNAGDQNVTNNFTYTYSADYPNYGGYGGAGGDGGYGAGAGIGGAGGMGGRGGAQREHGAVSIRYSGLEGNAGGAATQSGSMGKVYVLGNVDGTKWDLSVESKAGDIAGTAGTAGANGYYGYTTSQKNGRYYSIGGGGGGASGVAGEKPTYSIGAGGKAGGGGGSGGQGGADYSILVAANKARNTQNASCEGGLGYPLNSSADKRDNGASLTFLGIPITYTQTGGTGGAAGTNGASGSSGELFILGSSNKWMNPEQDYYKRINNKTDKPAAKTTTLKTTDLNKDSYKEIRNLYQITLSFDNQGGSTARAAVTMIKGDAVSSLNSFNVPTKAGYYFDGYYTEAESGERIFDHNGKVVDATRTFTESRTLYAHWISNKFTVTWDYSYVNQDGAIQQLNTTDKSMYAKVELNGVSAFVTTASTEANGTGVFSGHKIATATITAEVGTGTNTTSKIYVNEDQLRNLQISAIALSSNNISATHNKYISTKSSSHEVVLSAIPDGTYMQPWSVTITNEKKPDVLYVNLLRADSENGAYEVINQHTAAFACSNSDGTYSGTYPVWPQSALNQDLYYKVQIVGYEMDGVKHDVASMPLSTGVSSENVTITITQQVALPIVHFELNSPNGKTAYYASGTTEYYYAASYGESLSLSEKKAECQDNRFEGWTDNNGNKVATLNIDGDITVKADWADAVPPAINFTGTQMNMGEEDADGYYHESLDVYVHIEDANDGTDIEQWYYVAEGNNLDVDKIAWKPMTKTADGNHTITIQDENFGLGYVYIKSTDKDGNTSYNVSNQYKIDNQAPVISHTPTGRREDSYSVVCTDDYFTSIEVDITDNVGVTSVMVNGGSVDITKNQSAENLGLVGVSTNGGKIRLEKPGDDDRERDERGNKIGDIPEFKTYTITARDAAGNTSTRLITVYTEHEWEKDEDGSYKIQDGSEPTLTELGMLSHVNCTHCSRYILVNLDSQWEKVDTENIHDMERVQIKVGSVLVKDGDRIYHADPTINGAIDVAKRTYTNTANGIATVIKLTPNTVGAKVAEDPSVTTLSEPSSNYPLILDLNGQSIDYDGTPYTTVQGNANVTILLNDGNNRYNGPNEKKDDIPYRNLSPVSGSPIRYSRQLSEIQGGEGVWQSLYLPFEAKKSNDLIKVGTVKKAQIDSETAKLWINKWEEGCTDKLQAFTPYFFQHAAGEMILESATTELAAYKHDDKKGIEGCNFTIAGSLQSSDWTSGEKDGIFWTLSNSGEFVCAAIGQHQRPYRWVIFGDPEVDPGDAPTRLLISDEEEPESLEEVAVENPGDIDFYTLSGFKMAKNATLPSGIYIRNGQKVYVK